MRIRSAVAALLALGLTACGSTSEPSSDARPTETQPTTTQPTETGRASTSAPPSATSSPSTRTTPRASRSPKPKPAVEGIDASHHQGPIDWARVADHGIAFAYLKASEGTGFVDPRFAAHRRAARRHGVDVAGYHYFQLCSDGTAQAEHFASVLGPPASGATDRLPPAVDLELAGSCTDPPAADVLLAEVREFLDLIDRRYSTTTMVYLYPEFEARYGFADDLADHPQWVRRLGDRPPRREWQVWQYDDAGSIPGVSGGVDLNRMRPGG